MGMRREREGEEYRAKKSEKIVITHANMCI
jgi:hypothetical protein